MKKLFLSSKLFVSCQNTIDLTSLRLDNIIQLWDTSSVRIGLELVFLSLCSAISENLLFFVVPEESWFAHILSRDMDFLWRFNLAT